MKRLLFVLGLFLLVGCAYQEVDETTSVPIKVTKELQQAKADTVYVVKTENEHYYFDQNKELVQNYSTDKDLVSMPLGVILFLILIFWVIGMLIGINIGN